jgi:glycosyltransferase involved in cell wall biosynthesis
MPGMQVVDFVADPGRLKELPTFDRAVYHIGNNPWFHLDILRVFLLWPDTVVLHDTVLYYLLAGAGPGALLKELLHINGEKAFEQLDSIRESSPQGDLLRHPTPSEHPGLSRILALAPQLIVHNNHALNAVHSAGFRGDIRLVPLLHYMGVRPLASADLAGIRVRHGIPEDATVFAAFGFIGPTKRLDKVLDAFQRLIRHTGRNTARLLIVGDGDPIDGLVRERGLDQCVITKGFVADGEFRDLLASVDVLVNLRFPSHGESSATLLQAMSCAKACLVSDSASFAALPDEVVLKIPIGPHEVDDIEAAMVSLIENPALRQNIGAAARDYVIAHHAPGRVAELYRHALQGPGPPLLQKAPAKAPVRASTYARGYLQARVRSLVP